MLARDLNTALIAEEMRRGTRSIYVDYVDYDEIAHHAGIIRPESLAALDGLDRVLGTLEQLAERAPRRYHFVVVSDHGQSQGSRSPTATASTSAPVLPADGREVDAVQADVEGWGRAGGRGRRRRGRRRSPGRVAAKAAARRPSRSTTSVPRCRGADISVIGSGNLGLLYVHGPERLPLETSRSGGRGWCPGWSSTRAWASWPALDADGAPGRSGRRPARLDTGEVKGTDPLAPSASTRPGAGRAMALTEAPDLYLNSTLDPDTLDIAAFEPLVGAHGGLGGWQDRAVLLVPRALEHVVPHAQILGADHLHQVLVAMLESVGQRTDPRFRPRPRRSPRSRDPWSDEAAVRPVPGWGRSHAGREPGCGPPAPGRSAPRPRSGRRCRAAR